MMTIDSYPAPNRALIVPRSRWMGSQPHLVGTGTHGDISSVVHLGTTTLMLGSSTACARTYVRIHTFASRTLPNLASAITTPQLRVKNSEYALTSVLCRSV